MNSNPETFPSTQKVLLIDIGGTNLRTATAYAGSFELLNPHKENTGSLSSLDKLLQSFLDSDPLIRHIVFSVAGPKINNSMTN